MITYELAKQLKEAGFPQKTEMLISADTLKESDTWSIYMLARYSMGQHITMDFDKPRPSARFTESYHFGNEGRDKTVYVPTLSELIKACGDRFWSLLRDESNTWYCGGSEIESSSAEEAVARLWIKINKGE